MTTIKLMDVDFVHLVYLDRVTIAIVSQRDAYVFQVNFQLHSVHVGVTQRMGCGNDNYFIEDQVEPWWAGNSLEDNSRSSGVPYPCCLFHTLDRSNLRVCINDTMFHILKLGVRLFICAVRLRRLSFGDFVDFGTVSARFAHVPHCRHYVSICDSTSLCSTKRPCRTALTWTKRGRYENSST